MSILRISPNDALAKVTEGWTYLDVRTEAEFAEGHPAGAFNVPISHAAGGGMTPNGDFLAVVEKAFGKDTRLVVGCKAGGRSMRAAQALVAAGFTTVVDQRAGWDGSRDAFGQVTEPGWGRAGLPSEKGAPAGRAYAELKAAAGK